MKANPADRKLASFTLELHRRRLDDLERAYGDFLEWADADERERLAEEMGGFTLAMFRRGVDVDSMLLVALERRHGRRPRLTIFNSEGGVA